MHWFLGICTLIGGIFLSLVAIRVVAWAIGAKIPRVWD